MIPGVLLTGGTSRRMGRDKATIAIGTETMAARAARVLAAVCNPVIEVGPGVSGLPCTREDPPGTGPLAGFLAGCRALAAPGPVFLFACDLPLVDAEMLAAFVDWPGDGSVLPVVDGAAQYACARWSLAAIAAGRAAFAGGERSLRILATVDAHLVDEEKHARQLADVDTEDDLRRLGLS